jgi:hypothetical protein
MANVVVTNLMQEIVVVSVINRPTNAMVELNATANICKYRGLHERHHFIPMAMEVHNALGHDMDHFTKECVCLFHNKRSKGHLSLSFCIQIFRQCVNIALQCALASTIERKIVLINDIYSRSPIIIRFHDLYAGNIKRAHLMCFSFYNRKKDCVNK